MGVVLMVASASSSALSLGSIQGRAVIGRPLDLRVPVQLASDELGGGLCATARVHYGDLPVAARDVSVNLVLSNASASGGDGSVLRVGATLAVNEPFVMVDLSVGCSAPLSRSYVLLADPASVAFSPAPEAVAKAAIVRLTEGRVAAATDPTRANVNSPFERPPKRKPSSQDQVGAHSASEVKNTHSPSPLGSRLTLDPLALVAAEGAAAPTLRMSLDSFSGTVVEDASPELQTKREAARALWRALSSPAEDVAAQLARGALSESEAAQLRNQLASSQSVELAVRAQLAEVEEGRLTQPLVLGLFAGLFGALGGLTWIWWRRRLATDGQSGPWWTRGVSNSEHLAGGAVGASTAATVVRGQAAPIDIDVDTLFPSGAFRPSEPGVSGWAAGDRSRLHGGSDFLPSTLMDGARSVATEELFDLQQQVEFFISLGQADQAVDVLVNHIADSHEPSPLAYLDLLKLYHELGRKADYERLRQSFNAHFNGGAPEFDHYSHSRRGLERYETALGRIQAEWPKRGVLQVIERSIFRHDIDTPVEVFDLEAYRELLLLYGIAREVIAWNEEGNGPPLPPVVGMSTSGGGSNGNELTVHVGFESTAPDELPESLPESFLPPVVSDLDIDLSSGFGVDSALEHEMQTVTDLSDADSSERSSSHEQGLIEELDVPADPETRETVVAKTQTVDFDFSDLGEVESFTIKKSGSPE